MAVTIEGFDFDGFDAEDPSSPEIPFQGRCPVTEDGGRSPVTPAGRNRRVNNRALFPDSSESESESPTGQDPQGERESEDQSVLLEMKQMLSEVRGKVDQNEHVLKELQGKINL